MLHHKKIVVISLGGSLIIPNKVDYKFLEKFKKTVRRHYSHCKFVIACGGGAIARAYIKALRAENKPEYDLEQAGIRATRMNALFMMQFFGKKEANDSLPANMQDVRHALAKNRVVFCGALRWAADSTSDSTAAKLAHELKTEFINITNVKGLFTSDPQDNPKAKLIPKITWKDFEKKANKIKYHAGQHFVLDQKAATIIKEHKIPAYIIGPNLNNLDKIIHKKKFIGTLIEG